MSSISPIPFGCVDGLPSIHQPRTRCLCYYCCSSTFPAFSAVVIVSAVVAVDVVIVDSVISADVVDIVSNVADEASEVDEADEVDETSEVDKEWKNRSLKLPYDE